MSDYEYEVRETLREDLDFSMQLASLANADDMIRCIHKLVYYIRKVEELEDMDSSYEDEEHSEDQQEEEPIRDISQDGFIDDNLRALVAAFKTNKMKYKPKERKNIKIAFSNIRKEYFENLEIPFPK